VAKNDDLLIRAAELDETDSRFPGDIFVSAGDLKLNLALEDR